MIELIGSESLFFLKKSWWAKVKFPHCRQLWPTHENISKNKGWGNVFKLRIHWPIFTVLKNYKRRFVTCQM